MLVPSSPLILPVSEVARSRGVSELSKLVAKVMLSAWLSATRRDSGSFRTVVSGEVSVIESFGMLGTVVRVGVSVIQSEESFKSTGEAAFWLMIAVSCHAIRLMHCNDAPFLSSTLSFR